MAHLTGPARSMWGVPKRNALFTGRLKAMGRLQQGLAEGAGEDVRSGVSQMVVVGLGGVGKTQLATEFCYRQYGTYYGLVMWLRAEIQETIEGDIRQLAADTGIEVKDKPTEEIIEEVKAQLYRCQCPWLMVFDNLEDPELLTKYAPRGGKHGHILITTRRMVHAWQDQALQLECFEPEESLDFMYRMLETTTHDGGGTPKERRSSHASQGLGAKGSLRGTTSVGAFGDTERRLAAQLGHLPLAMAMACAYMRRCDVTSVEYLAQYEARSQKVLARDAAMLPNYPLSVASSLSLSLSRIAQESASARGVLNCLAYLAPDNITKPLFQALIAHSLAREEEEQGAQQPQTEPSGTQIYSFRAPRGSTEVALVACAAAAAAAACAAAGLTSRGTSGVTVRAGLAAACILGSAAVLAGHMQWESMRMHVRRPSTSVCALSSREAARNAKRRDVRESSGSGLGSGVINDGFETDEESEADPSDRIQHDTDNAWHLLKSYSLLTVRDSCGSIHRLLQVY